MEEELKLMRVFLLDTIMMGLRKRFGFWGFMKEGQRSAELYMLRIDRNKPYLKLF